MALKDLMIRAGNACEFCGAADGLAVAEAAPIGELLLCPACLGAHEVPADHWRCLEGAAWTAEPAVQLAVWRKLGTLDAAWAVEAREGMTLLPEVQSIADQPAAVEHRDSNGTLLAQGDTVVLIKDLVVKGANFTAKRGTSVRKISLVADNPGQIEGRVEDQRIIILTEFVKKS
ncbi:alkylphosphonate utilization protein [Cypionkella sp.]|jgi:protein PhnA|uniref:alkylphosphonate utilization protein n=1 Tax=Cypionkella sp. TaxID=2811411 RepID=UPI00277168C1|nr:alkylphosphonate utilization protein [Cypionkella sp.]